MWYLDVLKFIWKKKLEGKWQFVQFSVAQRQEKFGREKTVNFAVNTVQTKVTLQPLSLNLWKMYVICLRTLDLRQRKFYYIKCLFIIVSQYTIWYVFIHTYYTYIYIKSGKLHFRKRWQVFFCLFFFNINSWYITEAVRVLRARKLVKTKPACLRSVAQSKSPDTPVRQAVKPLCCWPTHLTSPLFHRVTLWGLCQYHKHFVNEKWTCPKSLNR